MTIHITNISELQAIEDDLTGDYVIDNDITGDFNTIQDIFSGTLDGQGHVLTLAIKPTGPGYAEYSYMIEEWDGATVSNIIFRDCTSTAGTDDGNAAIMAMNIGYNTASTISNIRFENCTVSGTYSAGMLNCLNVDNASVISKIYVDADCVVTGGNRGIGMFGMQLGSGATLSECDIRGTINSSVSDDSIFIGGLVSYSYGTIINCRCVVNINATQTGSPSSIYIGGITAYMNLPWNTITNCFYTGTITIDNEDDDSTICGICNDWDGTAVSCYWLDTCVAYDNDEWEPGDGLNLGVGKTTTQLKAETTFVDWNFSTIWQIVEGVSYPTLQWVVTGGPVTTLPATDLDWFRRSATFNGESTGMAQVYFKWGGAGLEHDSVRIPATASFSIYLHGATRDWWYYFQAVGVDSGGNKYYGEPLSFMLTQEEGIPAYVTKLIITGQPLVPMETMTLFAKDAISQEKFGKRTYSLNTQYSLSQDDTQVILNTILANNKDPRVNDLAVSFKNLKQGAFKDSIIAADVSTRITLINTKLGIDGDFWINNIRHTITEAGLSYAVEWRLERVYDTTPAP